MIILCTWDIFDNIDMIIIDKRDKDILKNMDIKFFQSIALNLFK